MLVARPMGAAMPGGTGTAVDRRWLADSYV